jgi:hypothetical protein
MRPRATSIFVIEYLYEHQPVFETASACEWGDPEEEFLRKSLFSLLRSRIIFMRLQLREKFLMRLRIRRLRLRLRLLPLPHYIARKIFLNELKFKLMFKRLVHMILYDFYCWKYELNAS